MWISEENPKIKELRLQKVKEYWKCASTQDRESETFDPVRMFMDSHQVREDYPLALIMKNPRNNKGYLSLIWEKVASKDPQEAKKVAQLLEKRIKQGIVKSN